LRAAAFLLFTGVLHEKEIVIPAVVALALSVSALSSVAATNLNPLNEIAPAAAANRTMTISPDTGYVNVQGGKIINVVSPTSTMASCQ
jgi:serine protease inhibitor ecotin